MILLPFQLVLDTHISVFARKHMIPEKNKKNLVRVMSRVLGAFPPLLLL